MYFIGVVGFTWTIMFGSCFMGTKMFPQNIWMLPQDVTNWTYVFFHGGQIFGLNMIYFSGGYILAVNFLNFSNYLPADFFSPIKLFVRNNLNFNDATGRDTVSFVG